MTSVAKLEANRCNAQRSTGPRTEAGKQRSALNALRHGFTGRLLVGLRYGPFADDSESLQAFVLAVLEELTPCGELERAEALNIAGLLVRRSRLVELEAMALAYTTRAPTLPPAAPGEPPRILESDLMRSGAQALNADLFDKLPRYESHLGRELDRAYARLTRLQGRREVDVVVDGRGVGLASM